MSGGKGSESEMENSLASHAYISRFSILPSLQVFGLTFFNFRLLESFLLKVIKAEKGKVQKEKW